MKALELDLSFENVTIALWDGETIKVEVQFHGPAQLAPALSFRQGTLRVASPKNVILNPLDPPGASPGRFCPRAWAPAQRSGHHQRQPPALRRAGAAFWPLSTTSGNLRADELTAAELAASSTSGSITVALAAAAHSVALSSTSGDLAFSGDCESLARSQQHQRQRGRRRQLCKRGRDWVIERQYGRQGSGGSLTAHTTSGSVELAGEFETWIFSLPAATCRPSGQPTSDCRFQSTSGGLWLTLPQNSGFALRYSTTSGQVSNAFTGHSGKSKGTDTYGTGGRSWK